MLAWVQLQLTAMTRGIYISQKTSRALGVPKGANHPDLLFDGRIQPTNAMSGECVAVTKAIANGSSSGSHNKTITFAIRTH